MSISWKMISSPCCGRKDFIHIGYLATDEFLEDMPVLIPENVDQFRKDLVFHPVGHVEVEGSDRGVRTEAANLEASCQD